MCRPKEAAMRTLPLIIVLIGALGCVGKDESTQAHTPTAADQKEAAELRKDLPDLSEVSAAVSTAKNSGKKLTPEQIDLLLNKFDQAENRLNSIEGRLVELETGDGHDHDHDDHDHDDHSDHDH